MSIQVKCFGSLRQRLGVATLAIEHRRGMTARDAWTILCAQTASPDSPDSSDLHGAPGAPPGHVLCARNHEYAAFEQTLEDGDEVAFFPPVTGG